MDYRKLISDIFTGNTNDLKKRFDLLGRKIKRLGYLVTHVEYDDDRIRKIPVIINNRNRYSCLLKLLEWLEKAGMTEIIIIDNASTYPPLISYYETTKYKVLRTGVNGGPFAIWKLKETEPLLSDFYIYTDADVVPDKTAEFTSIRLMYQRLRRDLRIDKIGFSLRIDNLPDHFKLKHEVIAWENQFWQVRDSREFWVAKVDTTFALYAPFAKGGGECRALRTDAPHTALHLPWYENSAAPGEEDNYYRDHAEPSSSHWTKLTAQ
jgi:hypothetical protein